jgi:hypothetical protein
MKVTKRGFIVIGLTIFYLFLMGLAVLSANEPVPKEPPEPTSAGRHIGR